MDDRTQTKRIAGDVAIAGAGMVGLTLALGLARIGLSSVVVDRLTAAQVTDAGFDGRVSALAYASCRMYQAIGLWPALAPDAQPINDIVVSDGKIDRGASPFFLHFDHREIGDEPLGQLVENHNIRRALHAAAEAEPLITTLMPDSADRADDMGDSVRLHTGSGAVIEARALAVCEGRNSRLRQQAGIRHWGWSYPQHGIVVTVEHERPHDGVAHEYFLPAGPFAILPMVGNRSSLVWTERADMAPAYMKLDDTAFDREVARRFGDFLGRTRCVGPRWSWPLSLHMAERFISGRLALVGDTAHGIHPIAGQGLNLGLKDVAALVETMAEAQRVGLDIGSAEPLERYQGWRRFDTMTMALATDGLNRLFSNDFGPLRLIRDIGMDITGRIGPLRRTLMRNAGGESGDLPALLRGEVPV